MLLEATDQHVPERIQTSRQASELKATSIKLKGMLESKRAILVSFLRPHGDPQCQVKDLFHGGPVASLSIRDIQLR
jgi:hypothetical protein